MSVSVVVSVALLLWCKALIANPLVYVCVCVPSEFGCRCGKRQPIAIYGADEMTNGHHLFAVSLFGGCGEP